MRKPINILLQSYVQQLFLLIIQIIVLSCSQNNKQLPNSFLKTDTLKLSPPVTVAAKAPIVTRLDTCPLPRSINIPTKPVRSYVLQTKSGSKTIQLLPPETKPASFLVNFQNYNTEQGLANSTILSSCVDKTGNLWFGTFVDGVIRFSGKSIINYTKIHGLANNNIRCILEDKRGNLWFGTQGGVSQYNGFFFTSYTTAHGLPNCGVSSILEDKAGILWFSTEGGGVLRYDGKSFTNYTTAEGLANNYVWSILEDKRGNILFGTCGGVSEINWDEKKLFTKKAKFRQYTTVPVLANMCVRSMLEDKSGNLWFGTEADGVIYYDGKTSIIYNTQQGLANNHITSIIEDKNQNIWFGTEGGGVSCYNKKKFKNYSTAQGLANNNITSIVEDKSENIWFSTEGGISRLDRDVQSFMSFNTTGGLVNNKVISITEDRYGNLWFGTSNGLSRLDQNGEYFTNYTTSQGLPRNGIRNILQDKNGNLWFSTFYGGGVSRYDGKSFTNYTAAQGLVNNEVSSILEDKSGKLWFGTYGGGVSSYDGKIFTNYTTIQGLINNEIECILEDKRGNLWFGTQGGVSQLDRNWKSFTHYTIAQGLAGNHVVSMLEDKSGNIWFGTYGGGISRYDGKSFKNYTTSQGMGDDWIDDIVIDKEGIVWIGTDKGFTVLKGFIQDVKQTSNTPQRRSLQPSNNISNDELETENFKPVFEVYSNKTGYRIKDIYYRAMCITREGIIWAGTSEKLIRFDYNGIHKNLSPPQVFIQSVKINNEDIGWYDLKSSILSEELHGKGQDLKIENNIVTPASIVEEATLFGKALSAAQRDTMRTKFSNVKFDSIAPFYPVPLNLVLPYQHNNITIDFEAIEPAKPHLVHYQYMLEGYDKQWNPVTDKTTATFGNIYEGYYTFKLKAQSPDGVWSKPVIYSFRVLPPWYRTWWTFTLFAIVVSAIIYLIYRIRLQQVLKVYKLRSNIARDLHDDVGSALSSIAMLSSIAQDGKINARLKPEEVLSRIGDTSKRMIDLMDDIVWTINPTNDRFGSMLVRMKEYAVEMLEARDIAFTFKIAAEVDELKIPMQIRKDYFLIFKEAVNNLAKYSKCSNTAISIRHTNHTLVTTINDDGKGFDQKIICSGNGLKNMQDRANSLKGKLHIQTKDGEGTSVTLIVPIP